MSHKIFRSILLVAGVVLLCSLLMISGYLYGYFATLQENQLRDELHLAALAVEEDGIAYLEKLKADSLRLTWIAADGSVLYDTQARAATMENHAQRQEVRDALNRGDGEGTRYSSTLMEKTTYCAHRLKDGSVLRVSASTATVGRLVLGLLQPALVLLLAALVLSGLLAGRLSRRIVEPLNDLDLDHPLDNATAYEELTPLLRRIDHQHTEINSQLHILKQKNDEFHQIIRNMQEGLVVLDERQRVLSINTAAEKLFACRDSCVGQDFLTLDRDHDMTFAIQQAFEKGHSELRQERGGGVFQFDISRIDSDGAPVGAVLLSFDITSQELAEQSRREFTANVSHELKTPLQGIIGSAELLESGMVKPEDVPRFIGHIHTEAARMVALIGDIIRLSQLDEGDEMPWEDLNLLKLTQEAAATLEDEAAKRRVSLNVTGQPVMMHGVRRLIYEIACNLLDNAVKYNREGGSVTASVEPVSKESVCLTVSDTGIGIPLADQNRVFERFFRVDKSHSKASGGTGLGLSIVKHAVQYHHGKVTMHSVPGEGTTIRVVFPCKPLSAPEKG